MLSSSVDIFVKPICRTQCKILPAVDIHKSHARLVEDGFVDNAEALQLLEAAGVGRVPLHRQGLLNTVIELCASDQSNSIQTKHSRY